MDHARPSGGAEPAIVCRQDMTRHPNTRTLPPQTGLATCAFGNVPGLVAYLRYGREEGGG
ncbi:hypothetical protein [Streptomyces violascens]|uniref:hypothetical protein n=1 Tax=Streptomyces violascens TaxID=67381 RepID=UPI00369F39FB